MQGNRREKDLSDLTGSVWMWFQSEEVQAESLTSITVVNQVAALHYLQQHDNPFNTWHTPGNKRLHPSASCWHVVKDPSLTFYEMSILSARTHATFKSACRAKAGRMQVFVFMWERARAPPPLPSAARRGETHTNTHNHTWQGEKLQCGAWRINCRIKVLMGNKREKTAIHHPGTGSNSHTSQMPSLSYCAARLWWQLHW